MDRKRKHDCFEGNSGSSLGDVGSTESTKSTDSLKAGDLGDVGSAVNVSSEMKDPLGDGGIGSTAALGEGNIGSTVIVSTDNTDASLSEGGIGSSDSLKGDNGSTDSADIENLEDADSEESDDEHPAQEIYLVDAAVGNPILWRKEDPAPTVGVQFNLLHNGDKLDFQSCSDGLFCFANLKEGESLLLNPVTEEVLYLPTSALKGLFAVNSYAVGVMMNGVTKVVHIVVDISEDPRAEVLTVGADLAWKTLQPPEHRNYEIICPTTHKDFLYWATTSEDGLLSFSLEKETFEVLNFECGIQVFDWPGSLGLVKTEDDWAVVERENKLWENEHERTEDEEYNQEVQKELELWEKEHEMTEYNEEEEVQKELEYKIEETEKRRQVKLYAPSLYGSDNKIKEIICLRCFEFEDVLPRDEFARKSLITPIGMVDNTILFQQKMQMWICGEKDKHIKAQARPWGDEASWMKIFQGSDRIIPNAQVVDGLMGIVMLDRQ